MITSARIDVLRELPDNDGFGWLTCLRAPQIAALAADGGPLQMSLFDQQDLAEIVHPDYAGERLIACRNPALAQDRVGADLRRRAVVVGGVVDPAAQGGDANDRAVQQALARGYMTSRSSAASPVTSTTSGMGDVPSVTMPITYGLHRHPAPREPRGSTTRIQRCRIRTGRLCRGRRREEHPPVGLHEAGVETGGVA